MLPIRTAQVAPNSCFALLTDNYMQNYGAKREDFWQDLCRAEDERVVVPSCHHEKTTNARSVYGGTAYI